MMKFEEQVNSAQLQRDLMEIGEEFYLERLELMKIELDTMELLEKEEK